MDTSSREQAVLVDNPDEQTALAGKFATPVTQWTSGPGLQAASVHTELWYKRDDDKLIWLTDQQPCNKCRNNCFVTNAFHKRIRKWIRPANI